MGRNGIEYVPMVGNDGMNDYESGPRQTCFDK
jgi:hypothetical protein